MLFILINKTSQCRSYEQYTHTDYTQEHFRQASAAYMFLRVGVGFVRVCVCVDCFVSSFL